MGHVEEVVRDFIGKKHRKLEWDILPLSERQVILRSSYGGGSPGAKDLEEHLKKSLGPDAVTSIPDRPST